MNALYPLEALSAIELGEEKIRIMGKIAPEVMSKICLAIENSVTLKSLSCEFGCKHGTEGAKAIGKAIEKSKTMTTLTLYDSQIGSVGAEAIGKAIEMSKTMTTLQLFENNIGPEGAQAIGNGIEKSRTMTSLDLSYTDIGSEEVKAVCRAIEVSKTMTTLHLRGIKLGTEGAEAIGKAIEASETMTKLDLAYTDIGYSGMCALAKCVTRRKTRGLSFHPKAVDKLGIRRDADLEVDGLGLFFPTLIDDAIERCYLNRLMETHVKIPEELRWNMDLREKIEKFVGRG